MKKLLNKIGLFGTVAILLIVACNLISGTWILTYKLVENEDLVWADDFYYASVDMNDDGTWEDHVDNIKDINLLGLEIWADNNSGSAQEYSVYITGKNSTLSGSSTRSEVEADAVLIIDGIPLTAGKTFISYGKSLEYVMNVEKLKALLETGEMKVFAYSDLHTNTDLHVDSVNIVITFTAGK